MGQAGVENKDDTDCLIVSKSGLSEVIASVLLDSFSDPESLVLSRSEALRIARDIVWRGTTPQPPDSR